MAVAVAQNQVQITKHWPNPRRFLNSVFAFFCFASLESKDNIDPNPNPWHDISKGVELACICFHGHLLYRL